MWSGYAKAAVMYLRLTCTPVSVAVLNHSYPQKHTDMLVTPCSLLSKKSRAFSRVNGCVHRRIYRVNVNPSVRSLHYVETEGTLNPKRVSPDVGLVVKILIQLWPRP